MSIIGMNEHCLLDGLVHEFRCHSRKATGAFRAAITLNAQIHQKGASGYEKFCADASIRKFYYPIPTLADFRFSAVPKPQDVSSIGDLCEAYILDVRKTFEYPKPALQLKPKQALAEFQSLRQFSQEYYADAARVVSHVQQCGAEVNRRFWRELGLGFEIGLDVASMQPIHGVPPLMAAVHHVGRQELELDNISKPYADMWAVAESLHSDRPIARG